MRRETVLAAIDIGTNAARIKLVRQQRDGRLELVHAQRDAIRPGEGVFSSGRISAPAAERLIATLRQYAALAARFDARVRAVATSALREASNREQLVARAAEAGIALEVISADEEARLLCLGVFAGAAPARALCLDVGGGSTEVVLALGELPEQKWTARLGALRLSEVAGSDAAELRQLARAAVGALPDGVAGLRGASGASGTLRAVVSFATRDQRTIATRQELSRAVDELAALGAGGRRRRFSAGRADLIVAGAAIVEALVARLHLETVHATRRGLRDGILVDLSRAEAIESRAPRELRDARVAS